MLYLDYCRTCSIPGMSLDFGSSFDVLFEPQKSIIVKFVNSGNVDLVQNGKCVENGHVPDIEDIAVVEDIAIVEDIAGIGDIVHSMSGFDIVDDPLKNMLSKMKTKIKMKGEEKKMEEEVEEAVVVG